MTSRPTASAPPAAAPPLSIGIDFGTSNTVIALAGAQGTPRVVTFRHGEEELRAYISLSAFGSSAAKAARCSAPRAGRGRWRSSSRGSGAHRFIQSFKTFAASAASSDTRIFGAQLHLRGPARRLPGTVLKHAGLDAATAARIVRRPAGALRRRQARRGAGDAPLRGGLRPAGAGERPLRLRARGRGLLLRPAAAAGRHRAGRPTSAAAPATSRSCASSGRRRGAAAPRPPLANSGIGIAGDTFDYRIIDHVVSPLLGKGGSTRSFGKVLPLPTHYFANFARWNQLAMMKANRRPEGAARTRARTPCEPEQAGALHRGRSSTTRASRSTARSRAPRRPSRREQSAPFRFREGWQSTSSPTITRTAFESWIAADVAAHQRDGRRGAAPARTFRRRHIDQVFLTGGSSFIPAIRRLFAERFGEDRLVSGDQFESIAAGLALIGREPDPGAWTAQAA